MGWEKGRQGDCDYKKCRIYSFRIWRWGFDCYLLSYAPDTLLPWHTDPVPNGKHWRINFRLRGKATLFIRTDAGLYISCWHKRARWFRPDIQEHLLDVYSRGCAKISFGFVKFEK